MWNSPDPSAQSSLRMAEKIKKLKEGMKKMKETPLHASVTTAVGFFFSLAATAIAHCWLSFAHPFGRCQYAKVLQTRIY